MSLPARERGSKQVWQFRKSRLAGGRSPRGSADRNISGGGLTALLPSRSPRGSADRNETQAEPLNLEIQVAPRAGARIETWVWRLTFSWRKSLPARERGSKHCNRDIIAGRVIVAPRAGARIETPVLARLTSKKLSRSPRGSADRNTLKDWALFVQGVAPRAGARIETAACA